MIILLNGHSLTPKNAFRAEKFALNLSERQSTATITIGPEAPAINTGDWLKDEDNPGAGIVWRVRSIDYNYETDTRVLNCEHLINSLKDRIMFGDVTPGTMAGKKTATTCTAKQAVQYILKQQSDWTLYSFGFTKSAPYNFNGDDLFSALETVSGSLLSAWWSYDFSVYPFRLIIKPQSEDVACEMRMDRNIKTLKRTIDRTRMYTRFYPIGKNNLHIKGDYVSKNEKTYGVVCKVETDSEKDTEAKLKDWANERLNNHAEPLVTVTISGLDLSAATGEALDKLTLGTVCRVPLPEFSTTITERITKLSWSDKIADPESVSITLANQVEDVASIVNSLSKSVGGGGRSKAKQDEQDNAWFVDTNEHVGMVAQAVAGPGADKNWSRVSSIFVDGKGIHQRVTKTEDDIVTAQASIEVNENAITAEVKKRQSETKSISSKINVLSNRINLVVTQKDGKDVVDTAQIVLGINEQTGSYVKIKAKTINLSGYVTMSDLKATNATIDNLMSGKTTATILDTRQLIVKAAIRYLGHVIGWKTTTINGETYHVLGW